MEMPALITFLVALHCPGVRTSECVRIDEGCRRQSQLLVLPAWGVCSPEPSGGLWFENVGSVGENSCGRSMPPLRKGVGTKTLGWCAGWSAGHTPLSALAAACPCPIASPALSLVYCILLTRVWSGWFCNGLPRQVIKERSRQTHERCRVVHPPPVTCL